MMKYEIINGKELSLSLVHRWAEVQLSNADLLNPYFCPEFTQAVAAVRNDVKVAVLTKDREVVGFFPFHYSRGGIARPVGLGLSDYHGVIIEPDIEWTAEKLIRGCNLVRWDFDHLLASQKQFAHFYRDVSKSPIIELSEGIGTFEASLDKSGRKQYKEAQRKQNKLEEQIGPVKFTFHTEDKDILHKMMQWKSFQCRSSGTVDYFSLRWCVQLIEMIHTARKNNFGGILSCLHAGNTLAAVHFVMYSSRVWHSWFPAYNDDLQRYSPGLILLYRMINVASKRGINYIDLGKGISLYKKKVMSGGIKVAEGSVEIPSFINTVRHIRNSIEQWSKKSTFKPILRIPGKVIKSLDKKKKYE